MAFRNKESFFQGQDQALHDTFFQINFTIESLDSVIKKNNYLKSKMSHGSGALGQKSAKKYLNGPL